MVTVMLFVTLSNKLKVDKMGEETKAWAVSTCWIERSIVGASFSFW